MQRNPQREEQNGIRRRTAGLGVKSAATQKMPRHAEPADPGEVPESWFPLPYLPEAPGQYLSVPVPARIIRTILVGGCSCLRQKSDITCLSLFLSVQCSLSVNIQGRQKPQAIRMSCPTLGTQQEIGAAANFRWAPVPWLKAWPKALIFISNEPTSCTNHSGDVLVCVSSISEEAARRTFGDGS